MNLAEIDLIVRSASLALLVLLLFTLIRDHRHTLPGRLAVALALGVCSYLIVESPANQPSINIVNFLLFAAEVSIYGVFWVFARTWFNDETRIGWRSWSLIALSIALSLVNWAILQTGGYVYWPTDFPTRVIWLVFALSGLWIAWKSRKNDLIETRRKLRLVFIWVVGSAVTGATLVFYLSNLLLDKPDRYPVVLIVNLSILGILYILILSMFRSSPEDLFAAPVNKHVKPISDGVSEELAMHIETYMTAERAYRDEKFTIARLAADLHEQEYRVRRTINGHLGYRNFPSFLNHYRLAEVKQALADPEQKEVPILTIALDAGFGSLAPFNRAFREREGKTPTQYRKSKVG